MVAGITVVVCAAPAGVSFCTIGLAEDSWLSGASSPPQACVWTVQAFAASAVSGRVFHELCPAQVSCQCCSLTREAGGNGQDPIACRLISPHATAVGP